MKRNYPRIAVLATVGMLSLAGSSPASSQTTARPQAQSVSPSFEVASIKQNKSGADGASIRRQGGGRVSVTNNTLRNIVRNVYNVPNFQIVGGPDWINNDRWDIVAKAADDVPPLELMAMMKALLVERFKLDVRTETRDMPVYALVVARPGGKLGPQLRLSTTDCAAIFAARGAEPPPPSNGRPLCGTNTTPGTMKTTAVTMKDLARNLSPFVGRIVIDKTGLAGNYDLDLTYAPQQLPSGGVDSPAPAVSDGPSIFTAVQEQLGLKLEAQRAPVEVFVVHSAERPVED